MDDVTHKAVNALDGMATIVRNEMLTRGQYVSEIVRPDLKESICGGRQYCAIGSLWVGYGIQPFVYESGALDLQGADQASREEFLSKRPGLRLAYDALNEVAEEFIEESDIDKSYLDMTFEAPIERLFEGCSWDGLEEPLEDDVYLLGQEALLDLISKARTRVEA